MYVSVCIMLFYILCVCVCIYVCMYYVNAPLHQLGTCHNNVTVNNIIPPHFGGVYKKQMKYKY